MKLNPDCMRDILLHMENAPYLADISSEELHTSLTDYSHDEIDYTILKMKEAGLVNADIQKNILGELHITLQDITYNGHQFLANIHSDNVWNKTKDVLSKIGTTSVSSITFVANQVVTTLIKNLLGI